MKTEENGSVVASLLSPPAPSGIAVIAVRGKGAENMVSRLFQPARALKNPLPKAAMASYGFIRFQGRVLDEVLVIRKPSQRPALEVCCHGGMAAATAILDALAASGASIRPWSELVLEDTLDHDLLTALLRSRGSRQSVLLAHLLSGCLREAFTRLEGALATLEDVGVSTARECGSRSSPDEAELDSACTLAEDLIAGYGTGRFLDQPPRVFLTGPPNAGKSTLFNAIVGERRVLTSKIPGTTRDTVEAVFQLDGFPIRLFDTPGFAGSADEELGLRAQEAARQLMEQADLCLHLIEPESNDRLNADSPRGLIDSLPGAVHLTVVNKSDLLTLERVRELKTRKQHPVSALKAEGIESLLSSVDQSLGLDRLRTRFESRIFNSRQIALVKSALRTLKDRKSGFETRKKISAYLASPAIL